VSLLDKLFARREPPPTQSHRTFGTITFANGLWENDAFELWGYGPIQLLIDAEPDGPMPEQEAAFVQMRELRERLLPAWLDEVARKHREAGHARGDAKLTGLSIPSLDEEDDELAEGWSIWFGYGGEDDPSYEVIATERDDWTSIRVLDEP
jgi:hypothetical protein